MMNMSWLESVWKDLRYGARLLRLSPGFAFISIASLGLGIGANTAIFQLLDAVRLRSLPVSDPRGLAEVRIVGGNHGMGLNSERYGGLTLPIWHQIRKQQQSFSGAFEWATDRFGVGNGSEMRRASGLQVSGEFFTVLGVQPWRGRLFVPEDETACPGSVAVVSYSYWQREMGGRELTSDTRLLVNGGLKQIIGVTPPGFFGLAVGESFDIALPFCMPDKELRRDVFNVSVIGRLRPGWTIDQASAELNALSPGIFEATALTGYAAETIEGYKRFRLTAYPAQAGVSVLRDTYDSSLSLLLGITGLVLLIACANLANLILARNSGRGREVAVRLALGASRWRLMRQLIAESGLLASLGAAIGVGIAQPLSRVLVWSLSTGNQVNLPIEIDWRVLLFSVGVTGMTCFVFGVAPAILATRVEQRGSMRAAGRGDTSEKSRFSVQRLMVVTQIAVSLVLLVAALLFVRSFRNLMTFDPGMREAGIAVAFLGFSDSHLPRDRNEEFRRQLLDEIRSIPGVVGAATTTNVPLLGGSWTHNIQIGSVHNSSKFTWVSPGYFQIMDIPLLAGRDLNLNDTVASPRVAVVNQTFVREYLGGEDPIGRTMRTDPEPNYPSTIYEIVGIIPDTKYNDIRGPTPPIAFAPASQFPDPGPWAVVMIRSDSEPAAIMESVRLVMAQKHPEVVFDHMDFQKQIRDGLLRERLMAMLSGFFGVLAAGLAMLGLYGVISYIVARRRNEIGIRVALGAQYRQVVAMVMREAAVLLVTGSLIGIGLALIAGPSAGSLLFGLKPHDPVTLIAGCVLLGTIAALASFIPARRAAKLDPMVALRHE
jgi:predicted permease